MAEEGFDVLITSDQKLEIPTESNGRKIGIIRAAPTKNQLRAVLELAPKSPVRCRNVSRRPSRNSVLSVIFQLPRNGGRSVPPFPATWPCSR